MFKQQELLEGEGWREFLADVQEIRGTPDDPEGCRADLREALLAAARPDAAERVADEVERNALRASDE